MSDALSRLLLARVAAGFMVAAGALGASRVAWMGHAPGTDVEGVLAVCGLAFTAGAIAFFLPWNQMPRWTLYVLAVCPIVILGANAYFSAEDPRIGAIYSVVIFMWVGITLPRGSGLALAPVLAVSHALPALARGNQSELLVLTVMVPTCAGVGELAHWLTLQIARAEQVSQQRARKMSELVDSTLALAGCQEVETLAKLVARGAATLYGGTGSLVLLRADGVVRVAGTSAWPGVSPGDRFGRDESQTVLQALEPGRMPLPPEQLQALARALAVPAVQILPVQGSGEPLGAVVVAFGSEGSPDDEFTEYVVCTLATQAGLGFERLSSAEALRDQSLRDPLTQVGNRRRAWMALEALKEGDAVAILDLDHFKRVNDTFGHAAGDKVLRTTADFLRASLRDPDEVFRYGGEEFLVILAGAGLSALPVLERIHAAWGLQERTTSFSAGVAVHRDGEDFEATVARADAALYEAKRTGRDRVLLSEA